MRSRDVAALVGISYRQLDYLARTRSVDMPDPGSGHYRDWPPAMVVRLALACHLAASAPGTQSQLPEIVRLAMAMGEDPPRRGYALLCRCPSILVWAANWADVRRSLEEAGAALVVRYDLDDLLGAQADQLLNAGPAQPAAHRRPRRRHRPRWPTYT